MTWIRTIDEAEATGPLAHIYPKITDPDSGRVDNILSIHALDPAGLKGHLALYRAVMSGSETFPPVKAEMIAWTVSAANDCHY